MRGEERRGEERDESSRRLRLYMPFALSQQRKRQAETANKDLLNGVLV